jgi:signal transduction histidine kinase
LLNNALKHASAENIYIQLLNHPQNMQLIFEDDGIGFDKSAFAHGNGWNNIVQRVEILKANLELDPVPGKGTHVYIKIPY